jgi:hypothetical protein
LEIKIEIGFAYTGFKWINNAKDQAGVICNIIGLRNISSKKKILFSKELGKIAQNISPYIIDFKSIIVINRNKPLSDLPQMVYGNKPVDGGHLILSKEEYNDLIHKSLSRFIRPLIGSKEYVRGETRYCLWIDESCLNDALKIEEIKSRIELVKKMRLSSRDEGAHKLAERSYQFRDFKESKEYSLIIPRVTSDKRNYLTIGFLASKFIILDSAQAIYDPPMYIMSILSSKIHMVWVRTVSGRLKSDCRYSSVLTYNTFPFPPISNQRKEELTQCTFRILEEREKHPEKTLAQLYDPDKMPEGLKEAHRLNDEAVERCYRSAPFNSDEERLEYLFKLYEKMIQEEKEKGTLFEAEKKTRKKK